MEPSECPLFELAVEKNVEMRNGDGAQIVLMKLVGSGADCYKDFCITTCDKFMCSCKPMARTFREITNCKGVTLELVIATEMDV